MSEIVFTPEERLLRAIYGSTLEKRHWITPEGQKAVRGMLTEWGMTKDQSRPRYEERKLLVILLRFGFSSLRGSTRPLGECYTLKEVGDLYGLTSERIRAIESQALRQLRVYAIRHHFNNYLPPKEGGES